MNKAIKIFVIIILVQITLVLAGWMYQKATGNKISNHLYDLSESYDVYKEKRAEEKYQKAHEKWWNNLTPEQKANYHREMTEIDNGRQKLKVALKNDQEFKECFDEELLKHPRGKGRYDRFLQESDAETVCGRRLGIIGMESKENVGLKYKEPGW